MSAHPFGTQMNGDVERLNLFAVAVSFYVDARNDVLAYEAVASDLDRDDPYLLALEVMKAHAAEVVKAHAMTLSGNGVIDRCIAALKAAP